MGVPASLLVVLLLRGVLRPVRPVGKTSQPRTASPSFKAAPESKSSPRGKKKKAPVYFLAAGVTTTTAGGGGATSAYVAGTWRRSDGLLC